MPPLWPDYSATRQCISGADVDLVPLVPNQHAAALFDLFSDEATWTYLRDGPFATVSLYHDHLIRFQAQTAFATYVIVQKTDRRILGKLSLFRVEPESRSLEIGYVVLAPSIRGTNLGKQALCLLIDAVFTRFMAELCKWRCDACNIASARMAAKFDFEHTQTLRNHMIVKGRSRDTLCFELSRLCWDRQT